MVHGRTKVTPGEAPAFVLVCVAREDRCAGAEYALRSQPRSGLGSVLCATVEHKSIVVNRVIDIHIRLVTHLETYQIHFVSLAILWTVD